MAQSMMITWKERMNMRLERYLPEQRLFLKSNAGTRFVRLRPSTQAIIMVGSAAFVGWTVLVTSVFFLNILSAGSGRDQVGRSQLLYEDRLNTLSHERDVRAREAEKALSRFYVALEQVSQMQSELLQSEQRRRELQTGIDVIQSTLRTTIIERDEARSRSKLLLAELENATGTGETASQQLADMENTLSFMTEALDATSLTRDEAVIGAAAAADQALELERTIEAMADRNNQIFAQLEEAVEVSISPLRKVFRSAGMPTDRIIEEVRRGYNGQGGPLTPLNAPVTNALSTRGSTQLDADTERANEILARMREIDIHREAAERAPLAHPIRGTYRKTSGFGPRWGRMHNGLDWAGPHGTDIVSSADGVVTHAGWGSGYGKLIKIRHAFGYETRYAHLTNIRVSVGQRVSRGQHIGDMGNTGRSTGTHLHYEIRKNGRPLNPQPFVTAGQNVF